MANYEGPRCIEEHELPELIDLLNLIFRPKGGDMGREYPRHVAWSNRENIRIIKENGRIVSHVATSIRPVCLSGISTWEAGIGAVATHPNGRGKGYASILMQDAVERSVEQGVDIMLISGDLGVYRRMHAVDCGIYPVVKIEQENLQESPGYFISELKDEDLGEVIELWKTLPTRYLLPREDWEALSRCKHVMDKPSQWWTVRLDNELIGFG
ncbi:MAG: GNAT family N-acetyltransferase, partial [Candidatus Hinthialibacter sp.]